MLGFQGRWEVHCRLIPWLLLPVTCDLGCTAILLQETEMSSGSMAQVLLTSKDACAPSSELAGRTSALALF